MFSPLVLRSRRDPGVLRPVARCPIDEFAKNVCMPSVPGCLDAHVHLTLRVERQRLNGEIAVRLGNSGGVR